MNSGASSPSKFLPPNARRGHVTLRLALIGGAVSQHHITHVYAKCRPSKLASKFAPPSAPVSQRFGPFAIFTRGDKTKYAL